MTTAEYHDLEIAVEPPFEAVELTLTLPVPVDDAWHAIADPPQLRRWLGTLWGDLSPGSAVRLDCGDGDFFALRVDRTEPPRLLEYTWRFLGISPENRITWRLDDVDGDDFAAILRLRDWEAERTQAATLALAAGWADFLGRLTRHLTTGAWSRYAWRGEIDASIELPTRIEQARQLLAPGFASRWLPIGPGVLDEGSLFAVEDDRPLEVSRLRRDGDALELGLRRPGWMVETRCIVKLTARRRDVLLETHHTGFREAPVDPSVQRLLRARTARTWVAALKRARALVPVDGSPPLVDSTPL